jgi:NarL family two-component system sensor histidine kinase LiaS
MLFRRNKFVDFRYRFYYSGIMSKSSSKSTRFNQFRWKLTLSYTAVTIGALLTVELFLIVAAAVALTLLLNSGLLQSELIEAVTVDVNFAPALRVFLNQTPPDQEGIAKWLENAGTVQGVSLPLSFDATDEMLVVGSDGRLLGTKPTDLMGIDALGQAPDLEVIPELEKPLQAALAGEEDIDKLYTSVSGGDRIVLAVPVWDEAHEQVLGVMVGMSEAPTMRVLLGDVLPIIGISLLFFTMIAAVSGTAFGFLAARKPVERLNQLAEATISWSQGDFTIYVDDPSNDELGLLTDRLNDMAQQLDSLMEARRNLAIIVERNRLARDLHDSAKQQAFAAAAQVSAARTVISIDPKAAEENLKLAEHLIYELRQELTSLIQELRPPELEGKGLTVAVRDYADEWSLQNRTTAEVRIQGGRSVPLEIEQTVFRIMQEALANVTRHSEADSVEITLAYGTDTLTLKIMDNGQGFDKENMVPGFGLRSMKERAQSLGGTMTVESTQGAGTIVFTSVPINAASINGGLVSDE